MIYENQDENKSELMETNGTSQGVVHSTLFEKNHGKFFIFFPLRNECGIKI